MFDFQNYLDNIQGKKADRDTIYPSSPKTREDPSQEQTSHLHTNVLRPPTSFFSPCSYPHILLNGTSSSCSSVFVNYSFYSVTVCLLLSLGSFEINLCCKYSNRTIYFGYGKVASLSMLLSGGLDEC
jgi:hypothetical protein